MEVMTKVTAIELLFPVFFVSCNISSLIVPNTLISDTYLYLNITLHEIYIKLLIAIVNFARHEPCGAIHFLSFYVSSLSYSVHSHVAEKRTVLILTQAGFGVTFHRLSTLHFF